MVQVVPAKIAVVFDCDDTIAPDTTNWLLARYGIDTASFWAAAGRLVKEGWDPPLAYMSLMLRESHPGGKLEKLTQGELARVAKEVPFFPGVPDVFVKLREAIESPQTFRDAGIQVEFYVISGGIEELIRHTVIARYLRDVWGCAFAWSPEGRLDGIKNSVTFTEKTRFLFQINKGLVGSGYRGDPYAVNAMVEEPRPIPFENMIYLGDGPSDIPCMSVVQRFGGFVFGMLSDHNPEKTYALGYGRRAHVTVPADFLEPSHAFKQLKITMERIAKRIVFKREQGGSEAPRY